VSITRVIIELAGIWHFDGRGKQLAIVASGVVTKRGALVWWDLHADTRRRIVMLDIFKVCAFAGAFAVSSVALAADTGQQRQLTWDQLIQACQNPTAFQSQRQPNAIRLTCEDTQFIWEVDHSDNMEIDNRRSLVASLSSDKFYVVRQESTIPMNAFQTPCPRLKEVQVTYTKSFALSCQEMIQAKTSMNDFCKSRMDQDLVANKSLATRVDTGNVYNMCAAPELIKGSKAQFGGKVQPPVNKTQPQGALQPSEKKER
jgi:hypothetical protein